MQNLKKTVLFTDMVTDKSKESNINEDIYNELLSNSYDSFCDFFDELNSYEKKYTNMDCEIDNGKKIHVRFKISGKKKEKVF